MPLLGRCVAVLGEPAFLPTWLRLEHAAAERRLAPARADAASWHWAGAPEGVAAAAAEVLAAVTDLTDRVAAVPDPELQLKFCEKVPRDARHPVAFPAVMRY